MPDPADLITPAEAAQIIGVSRPTLMKHIRRGNVGLYAHEAKRGVRFERIAVMEGRTRFRDAIFGNAADASPDETPPENNVTAQDLKKYIETLKVTEGPMQGQYFQVWPWEMMILEDLANPEIRQIALTVARANGKTTFVAAIACAYFVGPFAVPRGEIDIVASKLDQAGICFDHIEAFLKDRIENETYKKPGMAKPAKRFSKKRSQNKMEIKDNKTGAKIQALGSDPKHAHGLAPLLCIMDEPCPVEGRGWRRGDVRRAQNRVRQAGEPEGPHHGHRVRRRLALVHHRAVPEKPVENGPRLPVQERRRRFRHRVGQAGEPVLRLLRGAEERHSDRGHGSARKRRQRSAPVAGRSN